MGFFGNVNRGLGSMDDRQRATLLAIAGAASPNPKMAGNLGNVSQGLLQSIQAEADRKQREKESEDMRDARRQELGLRLGDQQIARQDRIDYQKLVLGDRKEARTEANALRKIQQEQLDAYRAEQTRIQSQNASSLEEQRQAKVDEMKQREEMAAQLEATGTPQNKQLAMLLRAGGRMDPMTLMMMGGGLGGMGTGGAPAGGTPQPTMDDLIGAGRGGAPRG